MEESILTMERMYHEALGIGYVRLLKSVRYLSFHFGFVYLA